MQSLHKLTTAKTNTLFVLAIILPLLWVLIPVVSFTAEDTINNLLFTTASNGPYRIVDTELFRFFQDVHTMWLGIDVQVFCTLMVILSVVVIPLCFYLVNLLYKRYKAGSAKLWQFLIPAILVFLATMFACLTLYVTYTELSVPVSQDEQVDILDGAVLMEGITTA